MISNFLAGLFLSIASFFGYIEPTQTQAMFGAVYPVGGTTYYLSGSGVTASATSIQLTSLKTPDGRNLTMSMFGTIGYGALEPGSSKLEDVTFTGITQNANGTATLTGVTRGNDFVTPYAASTTLAKAHAGGVPFILTNTPGFYTQFLPVNNTATSSAVLVFASTSPPRYDGSTVASGNQFVSFSQMNSIAIAGGATSTEGVLGFVALDDASNLGIGTASSSSGAPLVIQNKFATTTPGSQCTSGAINCLVATVNGAILATGSFFNGLFAHANTWTSSNTFNATTTITGSNVNSNAFVWNTLAYSLNSARQASSTVLMENGSGSLSWNNTFAQKFYLNTATGVISGSSATTTIFVVSVPANTLGTTNAISCRLYIPMGSATNTALLKLQASYGGVASSTILTSNIGGGSGNVLIENATILLSATGAASTQKLSLSAQTYNDATFIGSIGTKESTPNIDSTTAQPLILMAQFLVQTGSIPAGQVVCTLIR